MSQYIETIRLQDGELKNLTYHQARFEKTRTLELGLETHPDLSHVIQIYDGLDRGLIKCRLLYGKEIDRIEFELHTRLEVSSLKVVYSDRIQYQYKFFDRSALESLYRQRGSCDDILIVKNGCITDSYYANTAFWDGKRWVTPDTPLLPGTMRSCLIDKGLLEAVRITPEDLGNYQKIKLINAMNDLEEGAEILMDSVLY